MSCWLKFKCHQWVKISQGITIEIQECTVCKATRVYQYDYTPRQIYLDRAMGVGVGLLSGWVIKWLLGV